VGIRAAALIRNALVVAMFAALAVSCGSSTQFPKRTTATTLPEPSPFSRDDLVAGNRGLFDASKAEIEATLRSQAGAKLIALSFDSASNEVRALYAYRRRSSVSESHRDAFAWSVARTLSQSFWFPELVGSMREHAADPALLPRLRITIDRKVYVCSPAAQTAMAEKTLGIADWVRQCAR
jgi:hypothetical protein